MTTFYNDIKLDCILNDVHDKYGKIVSTNILVYGNGCKKCRSTSGLRKFLFWRVLHKKKCKHEKLYQRIFNQELTGFSISGKYVDK